MLAAAVRRKLGPNEIGGTTEMNAIGYICAALYGLCCLAGIFSWLYALYHVIVSVAARWRAMPGFRAGMAEIFWPKVQGVLIDAPSNSYLIHRNKSRRGMAVFLASLLLTTGVWIAGVSIGGWPFHSGPNHETEDGRSQAQPSHSGGQISN